MFDASRIGVVRQDWTALDVELAALAIADAGILRARLDADAGLVSRLRRRARIVDANPAFQAMVAGGPAPRASVDEILAEARACRPPDCTSPRCRTR